MWNDGDLPTNGESLYCPTPGLHSSIFPHSPEHQSTSIKDLSDDPHRLLSNTNGRPTGPDQSLVIVFHLHQTYFYYFDLSHTHYKSFPQMIMLLLTTHSPFVPPLFHPYHVSATHSFLQYSTRAFSYQKDSLTTVPLQRHRGKLSSGVLHQSLVSIIV